MDFNNDNQKTNNEEVNNNVSTDNKDVAPASGGDKANDNSNDVEVALASKTIEERSDVSDVDDTHRNIVVTEKDGTKIQVQLVAPGWGDAENIDAERFVSDGNGSVRLTPKEFHESLFTMFRGLIVDGKPVAEKFDWPFLQKHSRETYNFLMSTADTFLTEQLNAA